MFITKIDPEIEQGPKTFITFCDECNVGFPYYKLKRMEARFFCKKCLDKLDK